MYYPVIPYSFIYENACLCWRDVLWGYLHNLVDWKFVVGIADYHVSSGSYEMLEVDLICLGGTDIQEIESKLHVLGRKDSGVIRIDSKSKWLFVALKWVYENKEDYLDPLGEVELLYEEFDFPSEVEGFVRYMPLADDCNHKDSGRKGNLKKIFNCWSDYLNRMEDLLKEER